MEKDGIAARELKRRSREAFDGQAATYDGDTHGDTLERYTPMWRKRWFAR